MKYGQWNGGDPMLYITVAGGAAALRIPKPEVDDAMRATILETVLRPTINTMRGRGCPMKGALFIDLMLTGDRAIVIDYNVRFGDPATQTMLTSWSGDFLGVLDAMDEDYFEQLGANVLWLTPVYENPDYKVQVTFEAKDAERVAAAI